MTKIVHVAVGVIKQESKVFLTKRHNNVHQGGKWEFPGGKVELGESVAQALYRELKEEVAIEVVASVPLIKINHDYGDKTVLLDVYIVENFTGKALALEGQQSGWFSITELSRLNFPEANNAIIAKLQQCFTN